VDRPGDELHQLVAVVGQISGQKVISVLLDLGVQLRMDFLEDLVDLKPPDQLVLLGQLR